MKICHICWVKIHRLVGEIFVDILIHVTAELLDEFLNVFIMVCSCIVLSH